MNKFAIHKAANILHQGGLIAYPTEAVFGLGCDPLNVNALQKLLQVKNRSASKGLILVAANFIQLEPFLDDIDTQTFDRVMSDWPGPVTWLLPANIHAPKILRGKFHLQAVRISAHPVVQALCESFGSAIVSTSANFSSRPPARTALGAQLRFREKIDYVVHEKVGELKQPSEIRNGITGEIVRPG